MTWGGPGREGPETVARGGIRFERIEVAGVPCEHGSGGAGPQVLFLHGWGIGPRSYGASLDQLARAGCRVLAPAQPGFGGTRGLAGGTCSFAGYARWVAEYLRAVEVTEPVVVAGHSFGGGVAVQFAHDHPDLVHAVVACNGVGGEVAGSPERAWWEWGVQLGSDLLTLPSLLRVLPAVIGQALPNMLHDPVAMWRVGDIVRRADLRREVLVLKRREIPVTFVWSDRDQLVPHQSFSALCKAAGVRGLVVQGNHNWLIAQPARFVDVMLRAMSEAGVVDKVLVGLSA